MGKVETHAVLADHHFPFQDNDAITVAHKVLKKARPSTIWLLGDLIDFAPISRFRDSARYEHDVQDEIDEVIAYLLRLRRQFPDAAVNYILGNHDRRLKYFMWGNAAKLKNLRTANFAHQFRYDSKDRPLDLRVNFIEGRRMLTRSYALKHGTRSNLYATRWEAEDEGRSGMSGHMHRTGRWAWRTPGGGLRVWDTVACLCNLNPPYKADDNQLAPWNHGLATLSVGGQRIGVENVVIDKGGCIWRGMEFSA
jgi:predicted phosphodiesterase